MIMKEHNNPTKKILKPSVIHDDLPEVKKPEHLRQRPLTDSDAGLPENPERNYHHDELPPSTINNHGEIKHADDDVWNGEDA